jgi:type II secretory pathway component PulF
VLEASYESGVPIDRGLELAADASGTVRAREAAALVAAGEPVGRAIPTSGALPPHLGARLATSEMAGELSPELRRIAAEEFEAARTALDRTVGIVTKGVYALLVIAVLVYALTIFSKFPTL